MMIERNCYSIFQPDAMFTGGIAQTLKIARLCKEHGLSYTPHTWTNGIGFAVNLQLFAASGFAGDTLLEYPLDPPGWIPEARDAMLEKSFLHEKGRLAMPEAPGLGFEIDSKALRKYGDRYFSMNRRKLTFFALRDRGLKAAREMDKAKQARTRR
jgi:L-alanine-DL-glutamate epimerase-like enolase superfamily enzyme